MQCHILTVETGRTLDLRGQVWSPTPVHGHYQFLVSKQGAAGVASIAQTGDFKLAYNESTEVGHAELNFDTEARYEAYLIVNWDGQEARCTFVAGP